MAILHSKLDVDMLQVFLDSARTNAEYNADFRIGLTPGKPSQDFGFALAKS